MMKKIIYLSFVLPLILFSCKSTPEARFFVDDVEPDVGQVINFTNESLNSKSFEWDFGDGYGSADENPVHYYTATGTYDIVMTAFSRNGLEDMATITIEVKVPTLLVIEVVEYYDEYVVPDASVRLYPTSQAWVDETQLVDEGVSNVNGVVVFSHLDNDDYFVDVWETDHDNYLLANENIAYIRVPEVRPNQINWFVAWVDVVDHSKGEGRGDRSMVIRKLERRTPGKDRPLPYSDSDWQKLYDMSVKVR